MTGRTDVNFVYELTDFENSQLQVILAFFIENYDQPDTFKGLALKMQEESNKLKTRLREEN